MRCRTAPPMPITALRWPTGVRAREMMPRSESSHSGSELSSGSSPPPVRSRRRRSASSPIVSSAFAAGQTSRTTSEDSDTVTLLIGPDDYLVSCNARVLAATIDEITQPLRELPENQSPTFRPTMRSQHSHRTSPKRPPTRGGTNRAHSATLDRSQHDFPDCWLAHYGAASIEPPQRRGTMPRYRVTLRRTTVEIVEAANPYQAAIVASDLGGGGVEIANVVPAVGRLAVSSGPPNATKTAKKSVKKAAKKRRPMSAETRAKLAKNLVKARAARAAKAKSVERGTAKTRAVKKTRS